MRAGSPGHCAKFGSCSMTDLDTNRIVDIQLLQVTIWYIVFKIYFHVLYCNDDPI